MIDTILYRRFFMVAAAIACFGVLTANLMLETRSSSIESTQLRVR